MDGKFATPPRARDEDDVEVGKVATAGEGSDFGEEAGGDLVGEKANAALRF